MAEENESLGKEPFNLENWYLERTGLATQKGDFDRLAALNYIHTKAYSGEYGFPSIEALDAEVDREHKAYQSMTLVQRLARNMEAQKTFTKDLVRQKREERLRRN